MRLPVSMGGLPSIESLGRGISKMTELCVAEGIPKPTYLVEGSEFV